MQKSKKSVLQRIGIAVVATALGSAAPATDALARGGGGGGGGHIGGGGGHIGGGISGAHFGGAHFGGAHFSGGHFGSGRMAGGRGHGHFGVGRFGYYGGLDDDSCWPLDRLHPPRYDSCL